MNIPEVVLEDLIATDAWIRALARGLVVDNEEAKDVAQDAWVRALSFLNEAMIAPVMPSGFSR